RYGDANLDGAVDTIDLNLLAANFGMAAGANWTQADFNYDGATDTTDFNLLVVNFAGGLPADVPGGAVSAVVPEPTPVGFVAIGASLLTFRRSPRIRRRPVLGEQSGR